MSLIRYGLNYDGVKDRLVPGLYGVENGWGPWPVEYARRVWDCEGLRDKGVDSQLAAVVGPEERPWAVVDYTADVAGFAVSFLDDAGHYALSYAYFGPRKRYKSWFRELSESEFENRFDQLWFNSIFAKYWNSFGTYLSETRAHFAPDGGGSRLVHAAGGDFGNPDTITQSPWPGLDVDRLWVPYPELGEFEELLVPVRDELALFDIKLPPLRVFEDQSS